VHEYLYLIRGSLYPPYPVSVFCCFELKRS
jgi:hypothetical protein